MSRVAELQRALEWAHYARRHRDGLVLISLDADVELQEVALDVRLLRAYGVRCAVFFHSDSVESDFLGTLRLIDPGAQVIEPRRLDADRLDARSRGALAAALDAERIAYVPIGGAPSSTPGPPGPAQSRERAEDPRAAHRVALETAGQLPVLRVFIVAREITRYLSATPTPSLLTLPEVARTPSPVWSADLWPAIRARVASAVSVVLLAAQPGLVFDELFTHQGAGTLVGPALPEEIRRADLADATDIELLLRAEMERGVVRPVSEHEIARTAHEHLVYTIDELVVGTARLAPYGAWAELSRFATFPRYRGRGRARALGEALIEWGRREGFAHLFALSVDARMWAFFESLGFSATDRSALPESWRRGYDLSRPSRAFHLAL